jgi:hypothetical protein
MSAFELETVGSAIVDGVNLRGSELISVTTFAVFENAPAVEAFVKRVLES